MQRHKRLISILWYLYDNPMPSPTATELARAVGLKRTPYSTAMLSQLVTAGLVASYPSNISTGLPAKRYFIAEDMLEKVFDFMSELENEIINEEGYDNA